MATREAQSAIIIGATSGIGLALAAKLAAEGYRLGLTGRRTELLAGFRAEGHHVVFQDVAEIEPGRRILRDLIADMGGVDLVIVNAGRGKVKDHVEWENEKRTVDVNVTGFMAQALAAFDHFLEQEHGHLVSISSVAANRGGGGHPAYNASKAFVSNFMQGLRHVAHRARLPIALTDVKPGFVDTAMARGDHLFWVASPETAADQIYDAIRRRRKTVYVTKRWILIGWLMRWLPDWIVHRV